MGAKFTGEVLTWDNGVSAIRLAEYGGALDTSTVIFVLNEYLKTQEELRKDAAKKSKSDM